MTPLRCVSSVLVVLPMLCLTSCAATSLHDSAPTATPVAAAAPVDPRGLLVSVMKGDIAAVTRLVEADPTLADAADAEGLRPLAMAAAFGHADVVSYLIDRGAAVDAKNARGVTALAVAQWRDRPEIARLLIEKGADVRAAGPGGLTPLHIAAMNGQLDLGRLLLARHADLSATTAYGNTPLHLAATADDDGSMVKLLVDAGADVNAANALEGVTPLDVAVREGRLEVAKLLEEKGGRTSRSAPEPLRGPYLGQTAPDETPAVFAPDLVSTERSELCAVTSPDGTEMYFARREGKRGARIYAVTQRDGTWESPRRLDLAGDYSAVDMFMSADSERLYYCSNRPLAGTGAAKEDTDIWMVTREGSGWGTPANLGEAVNSGANDYYPTFTASGDLYFSSPRPGGTGGNDVYRARLTPDGLAPAENLGAPINTEFWEFDPFVAPDESFLLFASSRPGGLGSSDLYIALRTADGGWTEPQNLGEPLNSAGPEYTPMLTPDGRYLFFTSGRAGGDDIYWVAATVLDRFLQAR